MRKTWPESQAQHTVITLNELNSQHLTLTSWLALTCASILDMLSLFSCRFFSSQSRCSSASGWVASCREGALRLPFKPLPLLCF